MEILFKFTLCMAAPVQKGKKPPKPSYNIKQTVPEQPVDPTSIPKTLLVLQDEV